MSQRTGIAVALLALACSSKVELSSGPRLTASNDPDVIGVIDEQIVSIAVDDARVYWIGLRPSGGPSPALALRSCNKDHCVDSLVTYVQGTPENGWAPFAKAFAVQNGEIFWFDLAFVKGPSTFQLEACSVAGCDVSARTMPLDPLYPVAGAAFDGESAYVCGSGFDKTFFGVQRVRLSDGASSQIVGLDRGCGGLVSQGGYVYWLAPGPEQRPQLAQIQRARSDGSGEIQTIADKLPILPIFPDGGAYPDVTYHSAALAVAPPNIYWAQGSLSGSIVRCPLEGCSGLPELVTSDVRSPSGVLIDQSQLYFLHDTRDQGYAISRCSLEHCEPTPFAQGLDSLDAVAMDDTFLYTATTTQLIDPALGYVAVTASIKRVSK